MGPSYSIICIIAGLLFPLIPSHLSLCKIPPPSCVLHEFFFNPGKIELMQLNPRLLSPLREIPRTVSTGSNNSAAGATLNKSSAKHTCSIITLGNVPHPAALLSILSSLSRGQGDRTIFFIIEEELSRFHLLSIQLLPSYQQLQTKIFLQVSSETGEQGKGYNYYFLCPYCISFLQPLAGLMLLEDFFRIQNRHYSSNFDPSVSITTAYFMDLSSMRERCLGSPWSITPPYSSSDCDCDILFVETLGEYHNLSITYGSEIVEWDQLPYGFYITTFSTPFDGFVGPTFLLNGMGSRIVYCEDVAKNKRIGISSIFNPSIWFSPFQASVWVGVVASASAGFLISLLSSGRNNNNVGNSCIAIVALLLRQSPQFNGQRELLPFISLGLIMTGALYENYLTSRLIVPEQLDYFQSLKEVVENGFTIVTVHWGSEDAPSFIAYEDDYRGAGILDKINETNLDVLGGSFDEAIIRGYLSFRNATKKYALVELSCIGFYSNLLLEKSNAFLNGDGWQCWRVPELIGVKPYLAKFVFQGGPSFLRVMEVLRESGILGFFTNNLRGIQMMGDLLRVTAGLESHGTDELINISQLSSLMVYCGGLFALALGILGAEYLYFLHTMRNVCFRNNPQNTGFIK